MPKFTTAQRLKQILDERNMKQIDIIKLAKPFCELYNVKLGRNDLSQYLSGKIVPKQNKTYILAKALNVSEAWLMGFDVPKERFEENTKTVTLTPREQTHINKYRNLDDHSKDVVDFITERELEHHTEVNTPAYMAAHDGEIVSAKPLTEAELIEIDKLADNE